MERKIGEIFTYKGKTYQVVKAATCIEYAFRERICGLFKSYIGQCTPSTRSDKTSVIFKEINNMEIKNNQLTINIPEGMEVDVEHSDLSEGIIKFKDVNITLKDIYVYEDDNTEYANDLVIIKESKIGNKLSAIAKLIDIANYYNKGWKPNWNTNKEYKYCIQYNKTYNEYSVYYSFLEKESIIYFKNEEDTQSVIDNPNFRDILDAIYKD